MRKNAIILFAVLLALASSSAAQEGDWNYDLKTDGTARLTRYVGLGEPAGFPPGQLIQKNCRRRPA